MAKGKTLQAIVEIAGSISPTLAKSIDEATKSLGGIDLKAAAVGAAAAGTAALIVKGVADAGKALYDLGTAFEEAENTIRVGTGATGEALDDLMKSFDDVYSLVPTSMEGASQAISDYNTRLGLTGDELEELSIQAIQVSDMLGEDLGAVIEESSQAFQAWDISAEDMGDAMDFIFKASQSTGTGFNTLMTDVQKFAPQLQELGYSFEESAALVGQLDKAGVNADEVLGAMKKSVGALAKEGIDAAEGLALYTDKIRGAGTEAEAASIASEIFGTKAGTTLAAAIRDGALSVEELTTSLLENGETIGAAAEDTYTLADRMDLFKQKAQVALEPLASSILDSLTDLMPVITDAMEQILPILGELSAAIIPIVQDLVPQITPLISEMVPPIMSMASVLANQIIPPIVKIVTGLAPVLISIMSSIMPIVETIISTVMPIMVQLLNILTPIISELVNAIMPVLKEVMEAIAPIITQVFTALSPILACVGELISALLPPVISMIKSLMPVILAVSNIITTSLVAAFNLLKPVIQAVTGVVSGMASAISSAFSGLVGIIKTPLNAVISLVNRAIGAINRISIDVPDWVPGLGGKHLGFSVQTIPMLAKGGFTDGVSIAGEKGMEAVISFDKAFRQQNINYWAQAGQMLGLYGKQTESALAGRLLSLEDFSLGSLASQGQTIIYDMSGMNYNPVVNMQGESGDIMAQLRGHAEEFMDWMTAWTARKGRLAYG